MKDQILNTFVTLGFQLEEIEGLGYGFHYEGINYLFMPNEDDEEFLNIAIPAIVEINEDNLHDAMIVADKINSTVKYVKTNKFGSSLWLFYERELFGSEDMGELLSRMILHLESAMNYFRRLMEHIIAERENAGNDMSNEDTDEAA